MLLHLFRLFSTNTEASNTMHNIDYPLCNTKNIKQGCL